jgi:hypothetical protein
MALGAAVLTAGFIRHISTPIPGELRALPVLNGRIAVGQRVAPTGALSVSQMRPPARSA